MNISQFFVRFPEFAATDTALVQSHLDAATRQVDVTVWGVKADDGIGYLAAHLLALSPFGQNARLVAKDGTTTYEKHFTRLQRQVTSGFRVA